MSAGLVALVGYLLLPADGQLRTAAYALTGTACAAAVVGAARTYRPQQVATWYTFAAGVAVWLAGEVVGRLGAEPPWSIASLLLTLSGYPLICSGLVGLIRGRARADDRTGVLDAGIVAISLGLLYWTFVVGAAATDTARPWDQRAATVTYAAGDIVLFVLCALLVTTPGARTVSYRLIIGGLLTTLIGDILYATIPASGTPGEAVLLLSNILASAAALHPSMRRLTVPLARPPAFVRPRMILLAIAILLAPTVLLYQGATGELGRNWLPTGLACIALLLLVTLRMAGLVRRVETQARRLAQLANQDALTGLANRRVWDERLPAAMADSRATGETLIVGLLDLDHFKRYNDTRGHQAGDELLAAAATAWRRELRPGDLLARYGGEEFALLLTGRSLAEAEQVTDRLLTATPYGQTFSAGIVRWDGRAGPTELLQRADELLYASKHAGRARVTSEAVLTR